MQKPDPQLDYTVVTPTAQISPILHGWRGALVGQDLLALLQGECMLQVQQGKLDIVPPA